MAVEGEAGVDQGDEDGENVAHVSSPAVVLLGDFKSWGWDNLLPTQAHVCAEDDDSCQIEEHPTQRLKDFKLHSVDVAHSHLRAAWVVHPEKIQPQSQKSLQVQQVWRRAKHVRMSVSKAEPWHKEDEKFVIRSCSTETSHTSKHLVYQGTGTGESS